MAWLQNHWEEILGRIPPEVLASNPHEEPKIATKNAATFEPGSEEGTVDTYGTILSSLYGGGEDVDEVQSDVSDEEESNEAPVRNYPVTYAQVMKGPNSAVSQVTGWTEQRTEEIVKLQEKNTKLEDQLNTVTAELGELKNMLQQLLQLNKQQQEHDPPTKKKATFGTPTRKDRRSRTEEEDTEMRTEPAKNGSETGQDQNMEE